MIDGPDRDEGDSPQLSQRLDKWLWCARVAKTRTQASALVVGGKVRINRVKMLKPSQQVRCGDVVTISLGPRVKVLQICDLALRRGSAADAQRLFLDLSIVENPEPSSGSGQPLGLRGIASRIAGSGRPTKRDRRLTDRLKGDL